MITLPIVSAARGAGRFQEVVRAADAEVLKNTSLSS